MVFIERKAYAKMMLHGAKYPYYNVEGVLLGKEGKVLDAVPLSHGTILTNMVEVAVNMITGWKGDKLDIIGYYSSIQNDEVPVTSQRIALSIAHQLSEGLLLGIVADKLCDPADHALKYYVNKLNKWNPVEDKLTLADGAIDTFNQLLKDGREREVFDFDDHLANPAINFLDNIQM